MLYRHKLSRYIAGRGILSPTGWLKSNHAICLCFQHRELGNLEQCRSINLEPSQYLIMHTVTGKTWNVINIPFIQNTQAVQYSACDVTTLPTSSDYALNKKHVLNSQLHITTRVYDGNPTRILLYMYVSTTNSIMYGIISLHLMLLWWVQAVEKRG